MGEAPLSVYRVEYSHPCRVNIGEIGLKDLRSKMSIIPQDVSPSQVPSIAKPPLCFFVL